MSVSIVCAAHYTKWSREHRTKFTFKKYIYSWWKEFDFNEKHYIYAYVHIFVI